MYKYVFVKLYKLTRLDMNKLQIFYNIYNITNSGS